MELNLQGKVAVVTGASKGIGLAVAESLAAEGVALHLVARSQGAIAEQSKRLAGAHNVSVSGHAMDLTEEHAAVSLLDQVGVVDILVNNAGAIVGGALDALDDATWRAAWELKVFGYINMTRAFYPHMAKRGSGVIVNVTGLAGQRLDANYIAGTVANAGLDVFSRAQGAYGLDAGVRVIAVSPGPVATERVLQLMQARAAEELGSRERWNEYLQALPAGRAAHPKEIADVVTFLVSERAARVNGTVITVDGGQNARGSSFA